MGPVRLNVSKSGLGVSTGVRGARIGMNARGRAYVHGGRNGLYYRKTLSGKPVNSRQAEQQPGGGTCGMLAGCVLLLGLGVWLAARFPGLLLLCAAAAILLLAAVEVPKWRSRQRFTACKLRLDRELVTPLTAPPPHQVQSLRRDTAAANLPQTLREDLYQAVLDQVMEDGRVTADEAARLEAAAEILQLSPPRRETLHRELFTAAWVTALSDHRITQEDVSRLTGILDGLQVPRAAVRSELLRVNDLICAQNLTPPLPPLEPGSEVQFLQQSESLFYRQPAEVLSRSGQGAHTRWRVHRSGTLLLTQKRLLVTSDGTTQLRYSELRDVEVDLDQNLLILQKHGVGRPTWLRTRELFTVARMIDLLRSPSS